MCQAQKSPQIISLKHPESNGFFNRFKKPTAPPSITYNPELRPRFTARPGNVVVNFDRDHEIQQLQYVLQDGRLATLYRRNQQHPRNVDTPVQVWAPGELHRRDEVSSGISSIEKVPTRLVSSATDQTIEILNSKNQGVSQLVGDHMTVSLPSLTSASQTSNRESYDKLSRDDRVAILATIAADSLHNGVQMAGPKLQQAGHMLEKLKSQVGKKLQQLPGIIEAKLRAKSSVGRLFLENSKDSGSTSGNRSSQKAVGSDEEVSSLDKELRGATQASPVMVLMPSQIQPQQMQQQIELSHQVLKSE